jgi:hypothetical protein
MKKSLLGWAAAVTLVMSAPALAHHSPAAFEAQKTVTLTGTVKEFRWQNPHTWIEVLVPNEKGQEVLWAVELTSPTYLIRAGWKSTTLKPGDKVTVVGRPLKSGEAGSAIFTSVTLADGRTLLERPARLGGAGN